MGFDINFGALQYANPFAAYAQGQEIGQKRRQDQARREAGNVFATDPDRAAQIMLGAGDWEGGLTARKYAREDRQEKARTAAVEKYSAGDAKGARHAAIAAGDFDLAKSIASMDKEQREIARQNAEDLAAVGQGVAGMAYDERKAAIQQLKPGLVARGISAETIDAFDPTDENIAAFTNQALGLKGMLEQQDRAADNARADRQASETARHNRASEATSRGQLGVAQSNASRGWAAHNARLKAGGYGTPGVGSAGVSDNDVELD